jgi:hypothetical protein
MRNKDCGRTRERDNETWQSGWEREREGGTPGQYSRTEQRGRLQMTGERISGLRMDRRDRYDVCMHV